MKRRLPNRQVAEIRHPQTAGSRRWRSSQRRINALVPNPPMGVSYLTHVSDLPHNEDMTNVQKLTIRASEIRARLSELAEVSRS